ncbi:MAG: TetR/AcrR family transcriptional regulator [Paracoccaceae bacterium]|tara:strand:+ start:391 stop:993 length:603 start_codon:yes stop_codon:yes gene_type:complete
MARVKGSNSTVTDQRVREAALMLFAKYGYAAVSMRRIASRVGLQVGALYRYTPDKQSLLFDLLKDHMIRVLSTWEEECKELEPGKMLKEFMKFHIRFHIQRPESVAISYNELRNLSPLNYKTINKMRRSYEVSLEKILIRGQNSGCFEVEDTKLTTMALIAMLNGVLNWYKPEGRLSLSDVEEIYSEMALRSVSPTKREG